MLKVSPKQTASILLIAIGLYACNNPTNTVSNTPNSNTTPQSNSTQAPPTSTPTNDGKQHIDKLHLTIDLPKGIKVQDYGSFQLICNSEDIKKARCFTIEELNDGTVDYQTWDKTVLGTGRTLYIHTDLSTSDNGGKDEHLTGVLMLNSKKYLIKAEDHSDKGTPNARWCLPYIKSISSDELMG